MIQKFQKFREGNFFLIIAAILFCITMNVNACQDKRPIKTMNEKNSNQETADTGRLLSVANLELADSGRNIIAWFFETPQVFEFRLGTEQAQLNFKHLKDAKEKQLPVNVFCRYEPGKNSIEKIVPATEAQINQYNKIKAQRQQPVKLPPPPQE
jgi:hypothetical protein